MKEETDIKPVKSDTKLSKTDSKSSKIDAVKPSKSESKKDNKNEIRFTYSKLRCSYGRQIGLSDQDYVEDFQPNSKYLRDYIYRNPIDEESQNAGLLAESETNTERAKYGVSSMNHTEGGWPKDINLNDEDQPKRYRRKIEKDESYIHTVLQLSRNMEHCIMQNTTVNIYQHYYLDMDQVPLPERSSARTINVYQDLSPVRRPVMHVSWSPDDETKLAITYCNMDFQSTVLNQSPNSYIWEIENPNIPYFILKPHVPLVCVEFSLKDPNTLVAGMINGQISVWDVRKGNEPAELTVMEESHRDPVRSVIWLNTKSGAEFFSGGSDGQVKWWDTRKLSEPVESLILDMVKVGEPQLISRAQGVSCMEYESTIPTRFMVGTENGYVISGNRKGKSSSEKLIAKFNAHLGPVNALQRNPAFVKNFLTVGDWTARVWSEDCRDSSIIWTSYHKTMLTGGCWSPTKFSVFYLIREDGRLDVWDILKQQKCSSLDIKLCDDPLRCLRINNRGRLMAVGNQRGTTYLVEFSEDLTQTHKNDKIFMTQVCQCNTILNKLNY